MFEFRSVTLEAPLLDLLMMQSRGKIRRCWKRLSSPRRLVPTILVGVLLLLYIAQIYITLAFRETRTAIDIPSLAPLGMLMILLLKLLGICIDREKSGASFRDEETHNLVGGPFPLWQVRLYRVSGHAISIFATSIFAAIFLRFHVPSFVAALIGAYLAMLFTYLVYTTIAVAAEKASQATYARTRNLSCVAVVGLLAYCLYRVWLCDVTNLEFLRAFGAEAVLLSQTAPGRVLLSPFMVFTHIVVAKDTSQLMLWLGPGLLLNYLALQALLGAEMVLDRREWRQERDTFAKKQNTLTPLSSHQRKGREQRLAGRIPWFQGAGPIFWRQLKSASRLKGGLAWLLVPYALALALGGYCAYDPEAGAFQTIAVIVVLSSVFLPGLLPFDFRGDLQGLAALKMMPIQPRSIVIGQLAVPVLMLSSFQLTALSMLVLHDRALLRTILLTMCFLIPTNIVILSLENLLFLLYPYRVAEFDMQATVRRIVMLMAKFCVVFFAVLVSLLVGLGVLGLRMAVQWIPLLGSAFASIHGPLLVVTQLAALFAVATMMIGITCWAYTRFDLSEDLPI